MIQVDVLGSEILTKVTMVVVMTKSHIAVPPNQNVITAVMMFFAIVTEPSA